MNTPSLADSNSNPEHEYTLARWESRSGKHYCELYRDQWGYGYRSESCGGFFGPVTEAEAFATVETRILPMCQPDANTTPMRRVPTNPQP